MDDGELGLGFVGQGGAGTHLFGAGVRIGDDGTVLGVGHQTLGAQDLGVPSQLGHIGRGSQKDVEVKLVVVESGDGGVGEDLDSKSFAGAKGNFDLASESGFEDVEMKIDAFTFTGGGDNRLEGFLRSVGLVF